MATRKQTGAAEGDAVDAVDAAPQGPEKARAELDRWQAEQSQWEKDEADTRAELAQLEADAAGAVLSNRSKLATVTQKLGELRARLDIAGQAAAEASRRAGLAARVVVRQEAEDLQPQVDQARAAVDGHKAKAAELLAALEKFTNSTFREWTVDDEWDRLHALGQAGGGSQLEWPLPVLAGLAATLRKVERRQAILRAAADGGDLRELFPGITFDELPESLRPGGVLASAGFADPAEEQRQRNREALQRAQQELDEAQADVDAAEGALAEARSRLPKGTHSDEVNEVNAARKARDKASHRRDNTVRFIELHGGSETPDREARTA